MLDYEQPPETTGSEALQATGGPDDFGYTWDDSVAMNWIDATDGTDTGLSGSSSGQAVGPISLPFAFKYYENSYTNLYIAASGYLAFAEADYWRWQDEIPSPEEPNSVVAPYWTPLSLATSGTANRVYYESGGTTPNRYFAVEWYQVRNDDESYTFEVVLYENGDIVLQYQDMNYTGGYSCGAAGIEDARGLDGLKYIDFCDQAESNRAVRFYRPAPSARVSVHPADLGQFTRASEASTFEVPIRNTGDLGSDTYDITISTTWAVSLYASDGTTPLTDSDGDGTMDTGSIAQGGSTTVVASVETPHSVNVGDANQAALTLRSSVDTNTSEIATLHTTVPAPFAQAFGDDSDGMMSLYLVQPDQQHLTKASETGRWHNDMALAKMADGFTYAWNYYQWRDGVGTREIEYTMLDQEGNAIRGVTKLTDHSGATVATYDNRPAVAVTPDGHIGILWYRYLYRSSDYNRNYNIYFAILNSAGDLVDGPTNLTNNNVWGRWGDEGWPIFGDPRIAATADNRFLLAWNRQSEESTGWRSNIYIAARDTKGDVIKGETEFTGNGAGGVMYYYPDLASLTGSRALLAYTRNGEITYAVLDSQGNTVKSEMTTGEYGQHPDADQLSGGDVVLAWTGSTTEGSEINVAVLDGTTYNLKKGATALNNPASVTGDSYVSVAADAADHGILTWMESDYNYLRNLYYALVDSRGNVITEPAIFYTSRATEPYVATSRAGYGNTSYNLAMPTSEDVDMTLDVPSLVGSAAEEKTAVSAQIENRGLTPATSLVFTATIDGALGYQSATPAPTSMSGNQAVWHLDDMGFLGSARIVLHTAAPSETIGSRFPITWTVASAGPEADISDNAAWTDIMIARQIFLPLIAQGY
jgi:hypothetical protein